MKKDEIIEMAREAGFNHHHNPDLYDCMIASYKAIESFAKLVEEKATEKANARANASWTLMCEKMVTSEREACAKVCEELPPVGESKQWERATLKDCAAAIRARGEQA
jgi:hypothetical protein